MLEILCQEHYDKAVEFAKTTNQYDALKKQLDWLDTYATMEDSPTHTKCELHKDFAPYSFFFQLFRKRREETEWIPWFVGGLIYHGAGSNGMGAPEFSVSLGDCTKSRWEIHT